MVVDLDDCEVFQIPSLVESGYEVVDTAAMAMSQRFIACLDNDRMTDVYLIGEDSVKVPACKFILGSLSSNLQTLLYDSGAEDVKSEYEIDGCREKCLKALVEFSCSDVLNTTIWSDAEPIEIVEDLVALAKLAEIYALPNLKQQVSDVLVPCLEQLPSLACVAYDLVDEKTTAELHAAALNVLRKKPYQAFAKGPGGDIGGIACLSAEKLDIIFRDNEVDAEEIFLFQCLQEWKEANQDEYSNTNQICRLVAQNLDFAAMHASDIEQIVLPSGIVDSAKLVTGLMTLAKAAEKKGITCRSTRRHPYKSDMSTSSRTSGRGRRFKKQSAHSGSFESGVSVAEESRDAAPTSEKPPLNLIHQKRGRIPLPSFGKPAQLKSRATKFLGQFRHHQPTIKEQATCETEYAPETAKTPKPKKQVMANPAASTEAASAASDDNEESHSAFAELSPGAVKSVGLTTVKAE